MNEILIDDIIIKYKINFKSNKNTYFYFKKPGYIQINASKYQKKKEILKYIKNNSETFIKKYEKLFESNPLSDSYNIWGNEYIITKDDSLNEVLFNHAKSCIFEPSFTLDQISIFYKIEEKAILLKEAELLKNKYMNNGLVNISEVKIKTRSTSTRFGSCNFRLKTINLNLQLVHFDKKYIEYVFLHEIAHLVHQNHSSDFYLLLGELCMNHRELKLELNQKFRR